MAFLLTVLPTVHLLYIWRILRAVPRNYLHGARYHDRDISFWWHWGPFWLFRYSSIDRWISGRHENRPWEPVYFPDRILRSGYKPQQLLSFCRFRWANLPAWIKGRRPGEIWYPACDILKIPGPDRSIDTNASTAINSSGCMESG